jgi:plasmid stabilization system protein ParE
VPRVELSDVAVAELDALIALHHLPDDTRQRVACSLRALEQFPNAGRGLTGPLSGLRMLVGPWRWLLLVYIVLPDDDRVIVVSAQDARRSRNPLP